MSMLRYEDALIRILSLGSNAVLSEKVAIEDADDRVLAEDLIASADLPPFDYSSMDGYAVCVDDSTKDQPAIRLRVDGESRTGALPSALTQGTTMRIFTGAALPDGANAVVMQENVTRDGDVARMAGSSLRIGQNVRKRGADLLAGAKALAKGTRLVPAHLALAATLDRATILVARRPDVVIIATGDELRRPGTDATPGTIPESNTSVLRAMARRAGANARVLPFVRDDQKAHEIAFAGALAEADVVVTIGGVSVGDHDLVKPALEAVGVSLDFWKVAIKPGKPLAVGRFARSAAGRRDAIVIGLPGNPASAMVTFAIYGVPLLRAMQGDLRPFPVARRATMTTLHKHDPGRLEFVRGVTGRNESSGERNGEMTITTLANQASGAVTSMAQADALAMIPLESTGVLAGDAVDVLLMSDLYG